MQNLMPYKVVNGRNATGSLMNGGLDLTENG